MANRKLSGTWLAQLSRTLARGRRFANVGVLGRPENDGRTTVWYTLVESSDKGGQSPFLRKGGQTFRRRIEGLSPFH